MMASTTNENVEFENVMFDLPISNNKKSHSGNHLQHSDVTIELNNHTSNNGHQPDTTSDQDNSSITDVSEHVGAAASLITSNQTWFRLHYSSLKICLSLSCIGLGRVRLLVSVVCFCLIVYLSVTIHTNQSTSSLKCQMCQDPILHQTVIGSLFGNRCENGSLGHSTYDCGKSSACYEMNVVHSQAWKERVRAINHYLESNSLLDHFKTDPHLFDGTFRGCIKGFGFSSMPEPTCHFYNSTSMWHADDNVRKYLSQSWITTTVCTCTSDNCN